MIASPEFARLLMPDGRSGPSAILLATTSLYNEPEATLRPDLRPWRAARDARRRPIDQGNHTASRRCLAIFPCGTIRIAVYVVGIESSPAFVRGSRGRWLQQPVHSHAEGELAVGAARQPIEEPRRALLAFHKRYNETCLIERHRFLTATVQN